MTVQYRRYTEDELATTVMGSVGTDETVWEPEVHYNHYGDRGVVDLLQTDTYETSQTMRVYELKCQPAIEAATGANEILRQFNRHRTYFFKGTDYKATDYEGVTFELTFAATQPCYEHVRDNWSQYKHIANNNDGRIKTKLLFRSDNVGVPLIPREGKILQCVELDQVDDFNPEVKQ